MIKKFNKKLGLYNMIIELSKLTSVNHRLINNKKRFSPLKNGLSRLLIGSHMHCFVDLVGPLP